MSSKNKHTLILLSSLACIVACVSDFGSMFYLGQFYPGYSQLKNTMSSLGASISPVSDQISAWWIGIGILFIFFGIGVRLAFNDKGIHATIVSWLIILYGAGEGIGSGVFKADRIAGSLTRVAMMHDIVGGMGVIAILVLPLFMKKVILKSDMPAFTAYSNVVFILGILMLLLFTFRFSEDQENFLTVYKGLWQRLSMLNNYIYLLVIVFIILKKNKSRSIDIPPSAL